MRKFEWWFVAFIILTGFLVRLYRFDNPIADWHSWRQADTSAVSRNFIKYGFDLLHPRFDDLSNVASGLDNPYGYRFVEFPIYNIFQAGFYKIFGVLSLEEWGRIVTIITTLTSGILLYLILKRHLYLHGAIFAAFFFVFLPYSVYYGRTILPDEMMVTAILAGTYFFDLWTNTKLKIKDKNYSLMLRIKSSFFSQEMLWFVFSVIFTSASFLLKPYALFFTLPIIYLANKKFGRKMFKNPYLYIYLFMVLLPLVLWRLWMTQFPEGIPQSGWLLNGGNIRFKPSYFYWVYAQYISKRILGYFGISLFIIGLLKKDKELDYLFPFSFLVSSLLYLVVIARGNVQHDYYQILIVPTIAIFLGRGVSYLFSLKGFANRVIAFTIPTVIVLFTFTFSWYWIKDYFNVNNWGIVHAGIAADRVLPQDAKVIAPYNGDTSFLYQINRPGWASYEKGLTSLISRGANYMVIANPTNNDYTGLGRTYPIVTSGTDYLILKL